MVPTIHQSKSTTPSISSSLSSTTSTTKTLRHDVFLLSFFYVVIVPIYFIVRIILANKMPIMDCDEVYNYWEPLHYLLYGTGMQTWEYSNLYALRTYSYLLPLKYLAQYIYIPLIQGQSPIGTSTSSSSNNVSSSYSMLLYYISQEFLGINKKGAGTNKVLLFMLLRCTVAVTTAACELFLLHTLYWYTTKATTTTEASSRTSTTRTYLGIDVFQSIPYMTRSTVVWTIPLLLLSAGMNHSAGSFLPSTSWMCTWMVCTSWYLRAQPILFAFCAICMTLMSGWPFGCVSVIPMALHILYHLLCHERTYWPLVRYVLLLILMTGVVQYSIFQIDEYYYGIQYVSPTYNIFKYNAGGNGDTLYGVEPLSFYIKNMILNFNILSILGCWTLPMILFRYGLVEYFSKMKDKNQVTTTTETDSVKTDLQEYNTRIIVMLLSLPIWFLITVPRPHKEERFLFPIYPIIVLGSVITLQLLIQLCMYRQQYLQRQDQEKQMKRKCSLFRFFQKMIFYHPQILPTILFTMSIMFSLSRTMALYKYYTGPLIVFNKLAKQNIPRVEDVYQAFDHHLTLQQFQQYNISNSVCTCGEWYRYPSSFYLPEQTQYAYIRTKGSGGQLPQPFSQYGSLPQSNDVLQPFNDRNELNDERFVPRDRIRYDCKWFVVRHSEDDSSECGWPALYGKGRIKAVLFLDTEKTKSALHRILYVPKYHERAYDERIVEYDDYVVYQEFDGTIERIPHLTWSDVVKNFTSSTFQQQQQSQIPGNTNDEL